MMEPVTHSLPLLTSTMCCRGRGKGGAWLERLVAEHQAVLRNNLFSFTAAFEGGSQHIYSHSVRQTLILHSTQNVKLLM